MGVQNISQSRNVPVRLFLIFTRLFKSQSITIFKNGQFLLVCEDGFYNSRCNSKCGKCVNNEPCHKVTGECRNGCQLDLEPPMCQGLW